MKKNILVIVAHPDDESIGCGGTIIKHVKSGDKVYLISFTDGVTSRKESKKIDQVKRKNSSIKAAKALGANWLAQGEFLDNRLDNYSLIELVQFLEELKIKFEPDIIYTHNGSDLNIDHRKVFEAVLVAYRPLPNMRLKEIRSFEIASSTEYSYRDLVNVFSPNLFISIEDSWKQKLKALKCYNQEIRKYPHPRSYKSIENLAKYRGSAVGIKMAEAFSIVRKIEK